MQISQMMTSYTQPNFDQTRRIFAFTRALCWGETLVLLHIVLQGIFCNDGLSCNCFCIGMLKKQGYYLCIQVENIVM